jgi:hypothetical protein
MCNCPLCYFFQADQKWTCYRRKNFQLDCSFHFSSPTFDTQMYLYRDGHQHELTPQFGIKISVERTRQEHETIDIVKHARSTNKATIPMFVVQPTPPPFSGFWVLDKISVLLANPLQTSLTLVSEVSPIYVVERIQFSRSTGKEKKDPEWRGGPIPDRVGCCEVWTDDTSPLCENPVSL